jgi:hypothetical protein
MLKKATQKIPVDGFFVKNQLINGEGNGIFA